MRIQGGFHGTSRKEAEWISCLDSDADSRRISWHFKKRSRVDFVLGFRCGFKADFMALQEKKPSGFRAWIPMRIQGGFHGTSRKEAEWISCLDSDADSRRISWRLRSRWGFHLDSVMDSRRIPISTAAVSFNYT